MMVNLPCLMVSCTNFLRPTCSYTKCLLSFLTGSLPYGVNYCKLQLLFVFWFYWPGYSTGFGYSVDAYPASFSWSSWWCSTCNAPSLSGFLPEPCPISESSGTRQGSGINNAFDCLMLQSLPSFPAAWCPSTSSSDHRPCPSSESCKWSSKACRLSQSVTASFSMDCWSVLCNTHAAAWIHLHATPLTLPPGTASTGASCVLCGWSLSGLYACRNCMPPAPSRSFFICSFISLL